MLEWCFHSQKAFTSAPSKGANRGNSHPRRVSVKIATAASERVIGRAVRRMLQPPLCDWLCLTTRLLTPHAALVCKTGRAVRLADQGVLSARGDDARDGEGRRGYGTGR